jgi:hypothetical protein
MTDRYWLDPREVWTVTNPDGRLVAYVWEPTSTPVPLPAAPTGPPVDRSWLQVEDK